MTKATSVSMRASLINIMVELFFSVLPLIVLGIFSLQNVKIKFVESPEWSMTACILYGLSLTRFQNAMCGHVIKCDSSTSLISILPLLGVIISIILMSNIINGANSSFAIVSQFINLFISILFFIILGGYGISRSS